MGVSTVTVAAVPGVDIHAQLLESLISGALLSRPDWAPGLELLVAAIAFIVASTVIYLASPFASAAVGIVALGGLVEVAGVGPHAEITGTAANAAPALSTSRRGNRAALRRSMAAESGSPDWRT